MKINNFIILYFKDCKRFHENADMKKFFSLLAQKSEFQQLYDVYLSAVSGIGISLNKVWLKLKSIFLKGLGLLDEIRFHMTEMMLHTLITNRSKLKIVI